MKNNILIAVAIVLSVLSTSCQQKKEVNTQNQADKVSIATYFQNYYDERLKLFPLEATANGENRYNDQLPNDISESYRMKVKAFYESQLKTLESYNRDELSHDEQISYDLLKWDLQNGIEGFRFADNLTPINQFWSLPLTFGQLGSGKGNQPFNTVKDYENFLSRINGFEIWCDTAIVNMRKGLATGNTVTKILVQRIIPQMKDMLVSDVKESIFYMPVKNFPESFTSEEKAKLEASYITAITQQIIPSYKKLFDFFTNEYLPKCRTTIGIKDLPDGADEYNYLIKYYTTTTITPDSAFNLGMSEVNRLHAEMELIKNETGFKGDLKAFFKFMNTDKQFFPFKKPEEVILTFNKIHEQMEPQLKNLFDVTPKSKFEVRQTEKFREASASAEYNPGTADGSRPGIFYVPIPDARKFNTFAMEDLFLHEAIPGHHFQNMLTAENENLPMFRRFIWYGAYGEGWALYTESLGKELGLYQDPYQYFAALSEEMHRAIRLVVDVGIHMKGWSREEAIKFSMEHEGESEEAITAEVERYMAIPGQALSYKIGQLKIQQLRKQAQETLGDKFDIRKFHNEILNDGCLPLAVLEAKMSRWVESMN
ncbi:MAG TPA: DUF885 domain-containing protein [Bacteroidia bacterium]|nr:DUF885 domain-containing protein [Bacteroidia bacterium]